MTPELKGPAIVGKFYMVPCIKVDADVASVWMDASGWVPVLGPKHVDSEHLGFEFEHFHVDWRFIGHAAYERATFGGYVPHSKVVTADSREGFATKLTRTPELRRIKCKRKMPEFPVVREFVVKQQYSDGGPTVSQRWQRLERAQAFTCNKLKPGNICPHRGIDLTPFIKEDGTVVCPGHGLRWDTKTGDLLPHQAVA